MADENNTTPMGDEDNKAPQQNYSPEGAEGAKEQTDKINDMNDENGSADREQIGSRPKAN